MALPLAKGMGEETLVSSPLLGFSTLGIWKKQSVGKTCF
jgi:hypothetical protein